MYMEYLVQIELIQKRLETLKRNYNKSYDSSLVDEIKNHQQTINEYIRSVDIPDNKYIEEN